jgi:hypothetical protein
MTGYERVLPMRSTTQVPPDVVKDVAFAVYSGWGGADCHNFPVWIQGIHAAVLVQLDVNECDRRVAAGLGAITSPDVLRLLLGLPLGESVPRAALTVAERSALRAVPQGVISFDDSCVIRHVVPPLEVALALVPARSWRSGVERAGRFAPFCPRAMVLRVPPRDLDDLYMETGFYGIGVIVAGSDAGPEVLVEPARFHRNRFTVAGWRFLEEVYRQVSSPAGPRAGVRWTAARYPAVEGLPIAGVPTGA